jgi:hypothetical protein
MMLYIPFFFIVWLFRIVTSTVKSLPNARIAINLNIIPITITASPIQGTKNRLLIDVLVKIPRKIPEVMARAIMIQINSIEPLSCFFLSSVPERTNLLSKNSEANQMIQTIQNTIMVFYFLIIWLNGVNKRVITNTAIMMK